RVVDAASNDAGAADAPTVDAPRPAGRLVINEVDYDQAATDAKSFIEIYNGTGAVVTLADFAVVLINGGDSAEYARFLLADAGTTLPSGGYLVIRNPAVQVPAVALTIAATGDFMQNGPDGIALINTNTKTLVDALAYEGLIPAAVITGFAATVSLVEGTAFAGADTNDDVNSLARTPNGSDLNNAVVDWKVSTTITPGAMNP
ncbi:MAG: lamin tail domain-containing protein, partial [Kofleriaceae bacterium]|nr:lamin tail domain-containing protein [Kofleriaceae bacterium]